MEDVSQVGSSIPINSPAPSAARTAAAGLLGGFHCNPSFWSPEALEMLGTRSRELSVVFNTVLGAAGEGDLAERQ